MDEVWEWALGSNSSIRVSRKMYRTEVSSRAGGPGTSAPHLSVKLGLGREVTLRKHRIWSDGHWGEPLGKGERAFSLESNQ